jgi:hypothetical protein
VLGGQHPVALLGGNVTPEIRLVAEQAEAVLDFPDDVQCAA